MGGGRQYFETVEAAASRVAEIRKHVGGVAKEFHRLTKREQATLLMLLDIFGSIEALVAAAEAGKGKQPVKKLVREGITTFLQDHTAGIHRTKNVAFYLGHFRALFGERFVNDLTELEITRWLNDRNWGPKTFNDCRQILSQFFKYAIKCRPQWTTENPVAGIRTKKVPRSMVPIYTPEELKTMLRNLAKRRALFVPAIAIGAFAGLRISEIARLQWPDVHAALERGHFELTPEIVGKTLEARTVPMLPVLRSWLEKYRQENGPVLPKVWKKKAGRLSDLGKFISRLSKVPWKSNALRHSYATYRFKIVGDTGQVVDELGTSLRYFENHYRSRSKLATVQSAGGWFGIRVDLPAGRL